MDAVVNSSDDITTVNVLYSLVAQPPHLLASSCEHQTKHSAQLTNWLRAYICISVAVEASEPQPSPDSILRFAQICAGKTEWGKQKSVHSTLR